MDVNDPTTRSNDILKMLEGEQLEDEMTLQQHGDDDEDDDEDDDDDDDDDDEILTQPRDMFNGKHDAFSPNIDFMGSAKIPVRLNF